MRTHSFYSFTNKMSTIVIFMAFAILATQGAPVSPYDDIVAAANSGEWEKVQSLLITKFGTDGFKPAPLDSVRSLKPVEGGHVYVESEYTFHSATDLDGQKSEQSGGHKIINKDGDVDEYDFKPKFGQNPFLNLS